jgi:hypothetical protein
MKMDAIQMKNFNGKIGSYAISTVDFNSWTNQSVNNTPQKGKKSRNVKEVVNKIFAEYAALIDDNFWIEKFKNASMGKFPTKFSYKNDMLIYKKGSKSYTLQLPTDKIEGLNACLEFFHAHGGIFSPLDMEKSLQQQQQRASEEAATYELTWGTSNKKVQEKLLSYYVLFMKENMKLTDIEMEQLRETINLGIVDKFFGKHNITIKNKRIHTIDGLAWNNEKRQFYINPELKPVSTRGYTRKKNGPPAIDPNLKDAVSNIGNKWCKYLDHLNKKLEKELKREQKLMYGQNVNIDITSPTVDSATNSYTDTTDIEDEDEEDEDD